MVRVNLKLLAVLLASAAALAAGAHFVRGYQVRRNAGALLARAARAEEEGRVDRALHLLGRYILLEPGDKEARPRYGRLLEERARTDADKRVVMGVYEQALRRAPERHDIRRRQVRLAVEVGDYDTALGHLDLLEAAYSRDGELSLLRARCCEGKKRFEEAVQHYYAARALSADPIEAYVRLARLLRRLFRNGTDAPAYSKAEEQEARDKGQPLPERKGADGVMDDLVKKYPTSARAYLERAEYKKEFEGPRSGVALLDVRKALSLAPEDPRALLLASQLAVERGHFLEARAHLERGRRLAPRSALLYLALAELELKEDGAEAARTDKAARWLRLGLEKVPEQPDLQAALADLLVRRGELPEARELIARLEKAGVHPAERTFLEARALAREGRWSAAARLLEDVRPQLSRSPELIGRADLLLGACYQQLNDDRQLAVFRRAAARDAEDSRASLGLAAALLASGRVDESAAEYERLMRLPRPPAEGWVLLARVLALQNLQTPAARRDWGRVHEVLDRAAKATPEDPAVVLLRAEVLAAEAEVLPAEQKRGKLAEARRLLGDAASRKPRQVEFRVALAGLASRENDGAAVARILDDAERAAGDSVTLRLARARYARRMPGREPAAVLADAGRGAERFEGPERVALLRGLAEAHYALGSAAEALRLAREVARLQPGDLRVRLLMFDAALKGGDREAMAAPLREINSISGEGALWHYGQARFLVWQARQGDLQQLDAAHRHLDEVARRRATWSRVPLCRAEAFELEKKFDDAIDNYELALTLGDRQPEVIERLVKLLYDRGRYAQAEEALAKLQALTPISPDLQKLAAEALLQKPDFDRARELAERVVAQDSKSYKDQIWLARVLFVMRKPEEAEKPLLRAVELAGDVAEPRVALVQYRVAMGRIEQARQAIREARARLPAAEAPLALAHCYEAVGDLDEARRQFEAAVAARPDAPAALRAAAEFYLRARRPAEAVPHLRKLISPRVKAPTADVARARRELALALSGSGDYAQFQEALALLGGGRGAAGLALDDQRVKALVLGAHPAYRAEAAREFEALAKRAPLSAAEQFQLAKLYDALGRGLDARRAMQNALGQEPRNKAYLVQYALVLLRLGQRNDAALAIARLRDQGAWDFDAVSLQARLLAKDADPAKPKEFADRVAQLTDLLDKFVARKDASPSSPAERRRLAARLLDELLEESPPLGKDPEHRVRSAAEKWYRGYIDVAEEEQPESRLMYAGFLGRQGRAEEALDQCEKALRRCSADRVAGACVVCLQAAHAGPEHYARAERWLAKAAEKDPRSGAIQEALACAREHQGRYAEAERMYRDLLAKQPRNVVALNNLSYLLAVRGTGNREALELAERAIAVMGPLAELLDTRAVARLGMGKGEEAAEDLHRALSQKALPPAVRFHLAQALSLSGKTEKAAEALREAVKAGLTRKSLHPLEAPAAAKLQESPGVAIP